MLKKIINIEKRFSLIVILAIISFFSFNVLNKNFFKNLRFDLTKSEVYTLSDGTKKILKSINEPLDFKLFYTKQIGDINPVYQNYYARVKEVLEQYVLLSNNKICYSKIGPLFLVVGASLQFIKMKKELFTFIPFHNRIKA